VSCLDLFPQLGHPVLTESRVDLPQVQMWVVALSPATELTDLEAVAVLCRLAAGATALTDEPLDQQGIGQPSRCRVSAISPICRDKSSATTSSNNEAE
jgi:hypothetical protein